jgi:hypothetical protein
MLSRRPHVSIGTKRVPVGYDLYYEVNPVLSLLRRLYKLIGKKSPAVPLSGGLPLALISPTSPITRGAELGDYIPFTQSRLTGQVNPLRPPLQVEPVLIGKALGQHTGYLFGVGFRICGKGNVEAQFPDGLRIFNSYEGFEAEVTSARSVLDRLAAGSESSPSKFVETSSV